MLTGHDQIALSRLRRRLAEQEAPPATVARLERLAQAADRFSACPSVAAIWREMEFVVELNEVQRSTPSF